MTHVPETATINQLQISGADFWLVSPAPAVPALSDTIIFWHQLQVFYSKPQNGMHVTQILIYGWSLVIGYVSFPVRRKL